MKSTREILALYIQDSTKGPNSRRAYVLKQICDAFFAPKDFKKILGQTKSLTIQEIEDIYHRAKSFEKNPPALFWKLLREKNLDIKNKLMEESKVLKNMERDAADGFY